MMWSAAARWRRAPMKLCQRRGEASQPSLPGWATSSLNRWGSRYQTNALSQLHSAVKMRLMGQQHSCISTSRVLLKDLKEEVGEGESKSAIDPNTGQSVKNSASSPGEQVASEQPAVNENTETASPTVHTATTATTATTTAAAAAAEAASKYSQQYTNAYVELEKTLMARIRESNRRRFRIALISSIVFIFWVVAVFGKIIRKALTNQTADLAKETLENEALKGRTEELAVAVVHTVLNDPQVTANAAVFLREASMVPETQQALLKLTLHVLQHEESLAEVAALVRKLVVQLAKDKETVQGIGVLLAAALQEPSVKAAAAGLVADLCKDPEVEQAVSDLTLTIIGKQEVEESTGKLLAGVGASILRDEIVVAQSRGFVVEVMGDELIQREGGDAIWNSVKHALKPGVIRIAGISIVCMSLGLVKVMLSPF